MVPLYRWLEGHSYLTTIQRCWPHLIREVDAFKASDMGLKLSEEVYSIFGELKESMKFEDMKQRNAMKDVFDQKMGELVVKYDP